MSIDMNEEKNNENVIRMCLIVENCKRIQLLHFLHFLQQPLNTMLFRVIMNP